MRLDKDTGGGSGSLKLLAVVRGYESTVASTTYSTAATVTLKVKIAGTGLTASALDARETPRV